MSDKHEGVTDWEAAARIAMARADRAERELDALRIFCLDHIRETSGSLSDLLDEIRDDCLLDIKMIGDEHYGPTDIQDEVDADGRVISDADPGL